MSFTIQLTGAKDWAPYEGGGDLFPFEGLTHGRIANIEEGKSEKSGNDMLIFSLVCEEKEGKGLKAKKWVPVSGMRKDNKPNVIGLLETLYAVYSMKLSKEEATAKVRSLEGRSFNSADLIREITGAPVCFEVAARAFQKDDGSTGWSSEVKNFVDKQRYDDAVATNTHHRPNPPGVGQAATHVIQAPAAAGSNANGAQAAGGATAGGAPKSALGLL